MFKKFWGGDEGARRSGRAWAFRIPPRLLAPWVLLLPFTTGCRTVYPPLPSINLNDPGWTVHQGQAVWGLEHGKREIAGEVLVATRQDAGAFVQFTKTPFPIVIARSAGSHWEVQFPAQNKRYSGRGEPPRRLIWLYLPRVLSGLSAPPNWTWHQDPDEWRLENLASGESLAGYFTR